MGEALTKSRKSLALTTAEETFFDAMVDEKLVYFRMKLQDILVELLWKMNVLLNIETRVGCIAIAVEPSNQVETPL